ncbi:MAG: LegC family aminotransferase [Candidatus Omnitrophica bacterium]|nr:LegC family aminotransferase [Candidatus Omnitrophota bacterium]
MAIGQASMSAKTIPLSVPELGTTAWTYVKECLDTGWVSSAGPFVDRFEHEVAKYLGVASAVAVVNGTAALHLALLVAGVQPDEEVLVSDLSFVAPANAIRYVGAWPVFMDADPATWQMDPEKVSEFLTRACQWRDGKLFNPVTRRRVTAILPVHILGHPCDMDALRALAQRYQLRVIEDAAESLGAHYRGRQVGALGDIACLSFNGNKIITTGGGGMVASDNIKWVERARYLSTQAKDDPEEYIHHEIGYNYRLTNVQAALGCAQLEHLEHYVERKARMAQRYEAALSDLPGIVCMPSAAWADPTYWLFTVRFTGGDPALAAHVVASLASRGIQARRLWRPLHRLPMYRAAQAYQIEFADTLYAEAVSVPSSVGLRDEECERVIRAVRDSVMRAQV